MRRFAIFLVCILLLFASAPRPAQSQFSTSEAEAYSLRLINNARSSGLASHGDIVSVARNWSQQMANEDRLYHNPNYSSQICCWQRVAENVGMASVSSADDAYSVAKRLHDSFMASSGHRANILGDYDEIGIGVTLANNRAWITQNFRLRTQPPPEPEPEPEPEPKPPPPPPPPPPPEPEPEPEPGPEPEPPPEPKPVEKNEEAPKPAQKSVDVRELPAILFPGIGFPELRWQPVIT